MASYSRIEWTEYSWNPVTGCSKVSSGCLNCYAERMAKRFRSMGIPRYRAGFDVQVHPDLLAVPYRLIKPHVIFVNSMSDLFHEAIPDSFIRDIFAVMNNCPRHTFQILTKRSRRMLRLSKELRWSKNIWLGITVEDQNNLYRIGELSQSPARIKFISCEPLLGPISFSRLDEISWIIVGGESGPDARPMKQEWVTSIRDQCLRANIPFFFKQWGGKNKKAAGRLLEGKIWNEIPVLL
jgi:protein gp37